MPLIAAGVGGVLGAFGGAQKRGPAFQLSALGQQAQGLTGEALAAYSNLVGAGANAADVSAAAENQRSLASRLGQVSETGMFNMTQGNTLAAQQFAGQRNALENTFRDQLSQANRSAALAGRSSNDPILRARLAVEQSRQQGQLAADQSAAAVALGRQYTTDQLANLSGQNTLLQQLSGQAFTNQGNLFNMSSSQLAAERQFGLQQAQYEQSRGGGLQGALTGAMAGIGAGLQAGGGIQSMFGGGGGGGAAAPSMGGISSGSFVQPQFGSQFSSPSAGASLFAAPSPYTAAPVPQAAQVFSPPRIGVSSLSALNQAGVSTMPANAPRVGISSPSYLPRAGVSSPQALYDAGIYSWGGY